MDQNYDGSSSPNVKTSAKRWTIRGWIENNKRKEEKTQLNRQDQLACDCSSMEFIPSTTKNDARIILSDKKEEEEETESRVDSELAQFMSEKKHEWSKYSKNLVDTHCHFDFLLNKMNFKKSIDVYFKEYKELYIDNLEKMITVICNPDFYATNEEFHKNYDQILDHKKIYATIGCHPHFAYKWSSKIEQMLVTRLTHKKILAIGECGLDASKNNRCADDHQIRAFWAQLRLAKEMSLPIVIHCREAEEEVFTLMKSILDPKHKIHLHCFTGDWQMAEKYLKYFENLYIGITPLITQYACKNVAFLARNVPLDRLLFETDAPYFVPRALPYKSLDINHPGLVFTVAETMSKIRNISINNLLDINRKNVSNVYGC